MNVLMCNCCKCVCLHVLTWHQPRCNTLLLQCLRTARLQ